jgi:hypothetical protein
MERPKRVSIGIVSASVAERAGRQGAFNAHDKSYSVPVFVQPALALLSDKRAVSLAQLCAALDGKLA